MDHGFSPNSSLTQAMKDVILVLNSGSSSIKFAVFAELEDEFEVELRGQIEGIYTSPRFAAEDSEGNEIAERKWDNGVRLGHDGALAYLTEFLSGVRPDSRLIAVGHRVVHGGREFS